eukprot:1158383-Pelagomonas_calceolata.AAC.3
MAAPPHACLRRQAISICKASQAKGISKASRAITFLVVCTPCFLQAAHGVVDWGTAPGGADAVFDFGSLNIDFGAGVPEEIITYMASLPDELVSIVELGWQVLAGELVGVPADALSELYLSELGNHMTKLQEANNAAVAEHQQQLQAELLEQER